MFNAYIVFVCVLAKCVLLFCVRILTLHRGNWMFLSFPPQHLAFKLLHMGGCTPRPWPSQDIALHSPDDTPRSPSTPCLHAQRVSSYTFSANPTGRFLGTNAHELNCWVRRCVNTEHALNLPDSSQKCPCPCSSFQHAEFMSLPPTFSWCFPALSLFASLKT